MASSWLVTNLLWFYLWILEQSFFWYTFMRKSTLATKNIVNCLMSFVCFLDEVFLCSSSLTSYSIFSLSPQRPQQGGKSPETRVSDNFDPLCCCWELNLGLLKEHQLFYPLSHICRSLHLLYFFLKQGLTM